MKTQLEDIDFEEATDVGSIRYRLHPLDVGFDLREEGSRIVIEPEEPLRVSYPAEDGSRRVMSGPSSEVLARLRRLGFSVSGPTAEDDPTSAPRAH